MSQKQERVNVPITFLKDILPKIRLRVCIYFLYTHKIKINKSSWWVHNIYHRRWNLFVARLVTMFRSQNALTVDAKRGAKAKRQN